MLTSLLTRLSDALPRRRRIIWLGIGVLLGLFMLSMSAFVVWYFLLGGADVRAAATYQRVINATALPAIVHSVVLHAAQVPTVDLMKCGEMARVVPLSLARTDFWQSMRWSVTVDRRDVLESTLPLHSLAVAALDAELIHWAEFLAAVGALHVHGGIFVSSSLRSCPTSYGYLWNLLYDLPRPGCLVPQDGAILQPALLLCWPRAAARLVAELEQLEQATMERYSPDQYLRRLWARGLDVGVAPFPIALAPWLRAPFHVPHVPTLAQLGKQYELVQGCVNATSLPVRIQDKHFLRKHLGAFTSQISPSESEVLRQFLHVAIQMCARVGVPVMIYGGSLIGAARHGSFIPWDDDVDVFTLQPNAFDILIKHQDEFAKEGVGVAFFGRYGNAAKLYATDKFRPDLQRRSQTVYTWRWPFIDIFRCNVNVERGTATCIESIGTAEVPLRSLLPTRVAYFEGDVAPVPRSTDVINMAWYGVDWMNECIASGYVHAEEVFRRAKCASDGCLRIECARLVHFCPLTERLPIDDERVARAVADTVALVAERRGVALADARRRVHGVKAIAKQVCGQTAHISVFVDFRSFDDAANNELCNALSVLMYHESNEFGFLDNVTVVENPPTRLLSFECQANLDLPPPDFAFALPVMRGMCHVFQADHAQYMTPPLPCANCTAAEALLTREQCTYQCLRRGFTAAAMMRHGTECRCVDLIALRARATPLQEVFPAACGICAVGTFIFYCGTESHFVMYQFAPTMEYNATLHGALPAVSLNHSVGWPLVTQRADFAHCVRDVNATMLPIEVAPNALSLAADNAASHWPTLCVLECLRAGYITAGAKPRADNNAAEECVCGMHRFNESACDRVVASNVFLYALPYIGPTSAPYTSGNVVEFAWTARPMTVVPCVLLPRNSISAALPRVFAQAGECLLDCLRLGAMRVLWTGAHECHCVPLQALSFLQVCADNATAEPQQAASELERARGELIEVRIVP